MTPACDARDHGPPAPSGAARRGGIAATVAAVAAAGMGTRRQRSFGAHAPNTAPDAAPHAALDSAIDAGLGSPARRRMPEPTTLSAAPISAGATAPRSAASHRGGRPRLTNRPRIDASGM